MRSLEGLVSSLTSLSLLTLDGLTEPDFDVFGTLVRVLTLLYSPIYMTPISKF